MCERCNGAWSWYCHDCWDAWLLKALEQPLLRHAGYSGNTWTNYQGQRVHVLQIGLGTYGTFLHRDVSWMEALLAATSWRPLQPLKGIGVDPIHEAVGPFEKLAWQRWHEDSSLVSALLAAVAETSGNVSVHCLPYMARKQLRHEMQEGNIQLASQAKADRMLAYLENMASIDTPHPDAEEHIREVRQLTSTKMKLQESRRVPVYSFADLMAYYNSRGCEVLAIDAEGADCTILRSMISACEDEEKDIDWPWVIRFETLGHNDAKEERRTEEWMLCELQAKGYLLLAVDLDATLINVEAMRSMQQLSKWADKYFAVSCFECGEVALPSQCDFTEKNYMGRWQGHRWWCSDCCESWRRQKRVRADRHGVR